MSLLNPSSWTLPSNRRSAVLVSIAVVLCVVVLFHAGGASDTVLSSYIPFSSQTIAVSTQKWPPLYDNAMNRPTPAEYRHRSPVGVPIGITMTIFNQEQTIEQIVQAILDTTVGPYEFITIFDNCSDESEKTVQSVIDRYLTTNSFSANRRANKGLTNWRKIVLTETHYETLSNNIGLRAIDEDYGIIIQDDMLMVDKGWDRHLLRPALGYSDVLAITAKCAHNDRWNGKGLDWAEKAGHCAGHNFNEPFGENFWIRDVATRGPLLVDMNKTRILNYLSEDYYPQEMDDHDLCLRGYQEFGWVCGLFQISVQTGGDWSHRTKDGGARPEILRLAEGKAIHRTSVRHAAYLRAPEKHDEVRKVSLID